MKLDMDLVRTILIKVEEDDIETDPAVFITPEHDSREIGFHICMLKEAGYINAVLAKTCTNPYEVAAIQGLTWRGYDFLSAIRSDTVWVKTKSSIAKSCKETTLAVVKTLAEEAAVVMARAALQQ